MNKQMKPDRSLLQFMLRAQQQLARHNAQSSNKGYVMMLTSIITILMFSMLGAYLTMTNLNKSAVAAYADSNNTFYAAESALNKRAAMILDKFNTSVVPGGLSPGQTTASTATPTASDMRYCMMPNTDGTKTSGTTALRPTTDGGAKTTSGVAKDDFRCMPFTFQHNGGGDVVVARTSTGATDSSSDFGGSVTATNKNKTDNYVSYTFVADTTPYPRNADGTLKSGGVTPQPIPSGDPYAGLNALEYKYTVYATAAKTESDAVMYSTIGGGAQTVLQMDFKSRFIPLFQFAAFYENDLEMDSQTPMTVEGPVHTNGSLKAVSYGFNTSTGDKTDPKWDRKSANFNNTDLAAGTRLLGKVTAVGDFYDRSQFSNWRPPGCSSDSNQTAANQSKNCGVMAVYKGTGDKTDRSNYFYFPDFVSATDTGLFTPTEPTFGKRMEKMASRLNAPQPGFLREQNYKTTKTGDYYAKADLRLKMFPGRLPASTDSNYEKYIPFEVTSIQGDSRTASSLTKGQLRSLMQPVLVIKTPNAATTLIAIPEIPAIPVVGSRPAVPAVPAVPTITIDADNYAKVLKALKISIAASPSLVKLSDMDRVASALTGFSNLIDSPALSLLTPAQKDGLKARTPNQIIGTGNADARTGNFFLPPPIQLVNNNASEVAAFRVAVTNIASGASNWSSLSNDARNTTVDNLINNSVTSTSTTSSVTLQRQKYNLGLWDFHKKLWLTALQTNIQSLTYWNNEGVYVDATNTDLATPYIASTLPALTASLPSTSGLAFVKAAASGTSGFLAEGIAAADRTENGLVLHASVDDTSAGITTQSGDIAAGTDRTKDELKITGKDAQGNDSYVDNYRKYAGNIKKSPYGFIFSGAKELPAPMTIATDQAAYIQGDYNNPGTTIPSLLRQPAAIMADTVTVLSNQCSNQNKQVNCGGKIATNLEDPAESDRLYLPANNPDGTTNSTTINTALLSGVPLSNSTQYNGGLNRLMRMLENWSQGTTAVPLNYTGSFVTLGTPLESTEIKLGAPLPPKRNFAFDDNFNDASKLPPLTPNAVYLRQDVFKRSY
jgi:hypothetical protein